jgi:hypothetical protein
MFLGSLFAGYVSETFSVTLADGTKDYTKVFLVPLVLTIVCALVFTFTFRERTWEKAEAEPIRP